MRQILGGISIERCISIALHSFLIADMMIMNVVRLLPFLSFDQGLYL